MGEIRVKLVSVHVTNFRSVENSESFTVDQVTCLVGKNEAGKSAVLLALAALNPHDSTPALFDKERDYPRRSLTQYDSRHADKDAVAINTIWHLSESEMKAIADAVGAGVVTSNNVRVLRRYRRPIEFDIGINFEPALEELYSKFALDASERAVVASSTTTTELIELLKSINSPTAKHQQLQQHLTQTGTVTTRVKALLASMLPKFMYFSSYDRMEGAVQLEHTRQLIASGQLNLDQNRGIRLFVEFLHYAGVSIDDITSVTTYETFNAKLQAASNNITDQVLEYWTQNPDLSVAVRSGAYRECSTWRPGTSEHRHCCARPD